MITSSLQAGEIRDADVQIRIAAGDAAAVACVSAAAQPEVTMPHSAPVSSASRAPTASIELVEMDVVLRRRVHRRAHFGKHQRAADDRERAAGIDSGRTPID